MESAEQMENSAPENDDQKKSSSNNEKESGFECNVKRKINTEKKRQ